VPREYSAPYDAVYAKGWDAIRQERFVRMKRMGLIPENTLLPGRERDRAWNDLSEDEKAVFARYMAVYAGFIEHCDKQIGRLLDALRDRNALDNTHHRASVRQRCRFRGRANRFLRRPLSRQYVTPAQQRARIDELGTGKTQAEYPRPWAMAGTRRCGATSCGPIRAARAPR
jgi:arylsulfatase